MEVAAWRKSVHFLHANAFSQSFILSVAEWSGLRNQVVTIEGTEVSVQKVVVQHAFRIPALLAQQLLTVLTRS